MADQLSAAARFLELHRPGQPLLMPNVWDRGSARVIASLGFHAVATTSSGFAATLGRLDGSVTADEAIAHARELVDAVDVPVSADLENCFADDPDGVAKTVDAAIGTGLAGGSVEDFTGRRDVPIYDVGLARERVAAAASSAHDGRLHFVLTARAENHLHGRDDIADTIARLQAYQEAGADVLFAPGIADRSDIRSIVESVDRPVNVLMRAGGMTVAELAEVGVARVSVGGSLAFVGLGAALNAARALLENGTFDVADVAKAGRAAAVAAFG